MSLRTPILADALHHIDLEAIKREKGEANWSHSLVATDHVRSTLICQKPRTETAAHGPHTGYRFCTEGELGAEILAWGGT